MTALYQEKTDEELILLLRDGCGEVMDYLLEKYKPMVRRRANMLYLIGGDTEDLIQEGMIGLFKAIRDFEPDKNSVFSAFAQLCVSRQLYSALESDSRQKNLPLNTAISFSSEVSPDGSLLEDMISREGESPEQLILESERLEEFYTRLKQSLSKMEKEVLSYYLNGSNYIEIARIMGKSPKAIDNALQRIRGKVRRFL